MARYPSPADKPQGYKSPSVSLLGFQFAAAFVFPCVVLDKKVVDYPDPGCKSLRHNPPGARMSSQRAIWIALWICVAALLALTFVVHTGRAFRWWDYSIEHFA